MADIARAPTFSRQHRRPEPSCLNGPNLLTSTLVVVAAALPFNNSGAFPSQHQRPGHTRSVNADTSRGTPKTLTLDATVPFFNPGHIAPQPKARNGFVLDTSRGVPETLLPTGPVVAPFIPAPTLQVDGRRIVEVRSDVPPNLNTQFAPDQIATAVVETLPIYRQPITPANTSYRNIVALDLPALPPPFVNAVHWAPARFWWQPDDSSSGTPKNFFSDSTTPTFNAPSLLIDRLRPVADTSQGLNVALASFIPPAPFAQRDWPTPISFRQFFEPGAGSYQNPDRIPPALPPTPQQDTFSGGTYGLWDFAEKKKRKRQPEEPPAIVEDLAQVVAKNEPPQQTEAAIRAVQPEFTDLSMGVVAAAKARDIEMKRLIAQIRDDDDEDDIAALLMLL